jgi:hypothetical protein
MSSQKKAAPTTSDETLKKYEKVTEAKQVKYMLI